MAMYSSSMARGRKSLISRSRSAGLLHRHLIGGLTVNSGATADSWRTMLLLLSRPPEEVRADGGIAHRPRVKILIGADGRRHDVPFERNLWEPSSGTTPQDNVVAPLDPAPTTSIR